MTERRRYRLHWGTIVALLLVGGCLAWCDFHGSRRSLKYLWAGTRSFGWPLEHFDGRRDFSPARAAVNLAAGAVLLLGVAAVLEPLLQTPIRRPRLRLSTLLILIAEVAVLIALIRSEADWPHRRPLGPYYVPLSWYPRPVQLGILASLCCVPFAAIRWAGGWRWRGGRGRAIRLPALMLAVAVIAVAAWSTEMRKRAAYYRTRAAYLRSMESYHARRADDAGRSFYLDLRLKYEQAARHPWLYVGPDPPRPR